MLSEIGNHLLAARLHVRDETGDGPLAGLVIGVDPFHKTITAQVWYPNGGTRTLQALSHAADATQLRSWCFAPAIAAETAPEMARGGGGSAA